VSPEGGAIPLAYINTSEQIHKQYLYDVNFMYAIKHTLKPKQIDPAKYLAVHYVGGGNAMYGVADNNEIQNIAMSVYEDHNGIVSSICHGTAGIVNLKTKDGNYLVTGKRISGYPDSYENQTRDYFKQFPFLIQKTIENRGGEFFFSARNTPHVEVDGRIVTGQNHLSSPLVAEKMIEMLER
jgi:putative intracellular protease/amidase